MCLHDIVPFFRKHLERICSTSFQGQKRHVLAQSKETDARYGRHCPIWNVFIRATTTSKVPVKTHLFQGACSQLPGMISSFFSVEFCLFKQTLIFSIQDP